MVTAADAAEKPVDGSVTKKILLPSWALTLALRELTAGTVARMVYWQKAELSLKAILAIPKVEEPI